MMCCVVTVLRFIASRRLPGGVYLRGRCLYDVAVHSLQAHHPLSRVAAETNPCVGWPATTFQRSPLPALLGSPTSAECSHLGQEDSGKSSLQYE